ncbi:GNAT family N-acetyltransferase [Arthrobacter citreus]|uniref:GNAT family N-acetyltransferase n=1 Tax=Arthrobacter citreus TaxID=1670 RepID=UPI0036DC9310
MTALTTPTATWHRAWLKAHREWGPGLHEDGFGLLAGDEVTSAPGFAAWLKRLSDDRQCKYWWIVEGDDVLGGIALRHASHPLIPRAGHIGYGIRPSARRRGLATWAVYRVLEEAHLLGLNPVRAVCASNNTASIRTLEHFGGVLDKPIGESIRSYRIQTRSPRVSAHPRS